MLDTVTIPGSMGGYATGGQHDLALEYLLPHPDPSRPRLASNPEAYGNLVGCTVSLNCGVPWSGIGGFLPSHPPMPAPADRNTAPSTARHAA
jgi:hypothetical protein